MMPWKLALALLLAANGYVPPDRDSIDIRALLGQGKAR